MALSCRDRTREWSALLERLQRNHGEAEAGPRQNAENGFSKDACKLGRAIRDTANNVARLSKLAKGSSMFDDPAREIQELTAVVTLDITGLNNSIQELEFLHSQQIGDIRTSSSHNVEHCKMILTDLKGKLAQTTNDFKEVLTTRTENLKLHESRKHLFMATTSVGLEGSAKAKHAVLPSSSAQTSLNHTPPPWAKSSLPSQSSSGAGVPDSMGNTQLRRRIGVGSTLSSMQLQQEMASTQDRSRSFSALQAVESTIGELSGMFSQVAVMVSQQGELAIRIDDNLDDSLANVEGAQGSLLKHLQSVSSNRWLILKILFVLIVFLVIFIFILG